METGEKPDFSAPFFNQLADLMKGIICSVPTNKCTTITNIAAAQLGAKLFGNKSRRLIAVSSSASQVLFPLTSFCLGSRARCLRA